MNDSIKLIINPLKREIGLTAKSNLLEVFLAEGVKIPVLCNKNGSCGKCRVVVKAETSPLTEVEILSLGETLISEGYRLACRTEILGSGEVFIPLESREDMLESTYFGNELTAIRNKDFPYPVRHGIGNARGRYMAAVDMGTTTLTGYLFDHNGNILSNCSCFNPTTLYGCDIITRITNLKNGNNFQKLRNSLLSEIKRLLNTLCFRAKDINADNGKPAVPDSVCKIAVCGNTIMQHIFMGINPVEIGLFPYRPIVKDLLHVKAVELKDFQIMGLAGDAEVVIAPSVSGFIGGDAVCGVLATGLHKASEPCLLIDLGTNGEMVLNYRGNIFAASASAGPAFEGYQIGSGMRATIGAIDFVRIDDDSNINYSVIGGVRPKGICGTGAISAVSSMIKRGILNEKGHIVPPIATSRMRKGSIVIAAENETSIGRPIIFTDKDIEVIQQAKAAFASGIACLLRAAGLEAEQLKKILIAGAFGSSVDVESLKTIGLIPYKTDAEIVSVGNAAGAGIAMTLLCEDAEREAMEVSGAIKTVEFAFMKEFDDEFLEALFFRADAIR
ncbi:MAG: ASKHA domain-containing protein [Nitrospirae bacterium]|nr:ASKHA domain-containing protein [Nitrospirota bacterium]MCL5977241.1 ASKHA domain-containing protein [Nitrospirota bacterium]